MTTKLEAMVDHLAGREGDPQILEELADSSSEASRFLEATRARSKALLEAPALGEETGRPNSRSGRLQPSLVLIALVCLLAVGFASWLVYARFLRLEASLIRSEVSSIEMVRKFDEILARLPESRPSPAPPSPIEASIGRIEAEFHGLEQRIRDLDEKAAADKLVPAFVTVREELATLRRDNSSAEKTRSRQSEEMLTSVHEVARLLRLLLNRTQSTESTESPQTPGFPPPRPATPGDPRLNRP